MTEIRNLPWWQSKALEEMNTEEWESLCDHCAKCCLIKLEDEEYIIVKEEDILAVIK